MTAAGLLLAGTAVCAQEGQPPAQPAAPVVDVAEILKTCFPCHGDGAVSRIPTRPTIAGQKADYVARQLTAFKRSAREMDQAASPAQSGRFDPIMSHMALTLDDDVIGAVADAVSKLACKGDKDDKAPQANPPAAPGITVHCVACHGENGISRVPQVPNVAGQQRAYLRRQLLLIRETAWGAKPRGNETWRSHPIMERQAARLSIEDVDALAQYYAALDCRGSQQP